MRVLKCHPGIGNAVEGVALVGSDDFSARYDLDRIRGVFSRKAHALYGKDYRGTILVLNNAKGGVASAWMLREMATRKVCPAAFVFNRVNPILAQGASFGDLAMLDRFEDGDVTKLIKNGSRVRIEPAEGRLTILQEP